MAKYKCPVCKTKNKEDVQYCVRCGNWLPGNIHPATRVTGRSFSSFLVHMLKCIIGMIIGWALAELLLYVLMR
jgi:hypothetical protein